MQRFDRSGLTQREFCRRECISQSALRSQRSRRRGEHPGTVSLQRVESTAVEVAADAGSGFIPLGFVQGGLPNREESELVVELPYGVVLRFRGVAR